MLYIPLEKGDNVQRYQAGTFVQRLDFLRQSSLGLLTLWDLSQALRPTLV